MHIIIVPHTLYVVGTPIGNREDITLRAIRILGSAPVIAAEDTRRTGALLAHLGITARLISYREHNRDAAANRVLDYLKEHDVALVSDAGMPGISDPGAELVERVLRAGHRVEVIPGPTAMTTALLASGLTPAPFTFIGFLSRQRSNRQRQLAALAPRTETLVFYEAPHRLRQTLADLNGAFGDREVAVCRELTKLHEETLRGPLSALRAHFTEVEPRGEFTLVVHGAEEATQAPVDASAIDARLQAAMGSGEDMRAVIAALVVATGQPRRSIYAQWQALRKADGR